MDRTLNSLNIGQSGVVKSLSGAGAQKQRFLEFGIIKGTVITPLFKSPFGDPVAYLIRNTVIALRRDDCKNIIIDDILCRT